jgi:hypothetical protein
MFGLLRLDLVDRRLARVAHLGHHYAASSEASVPNSQERPTSRAHIAFASSGGQVGTAEVEEARRCPEPAI